MTLAIYGILVVLALFIVLMVFNPNLSCFGRRLKSPIYPLLRRKKQKRMRTTDYGFKLGDQAKKGSPIDKKESKTETSPEGGKKKNIAVQELTNTGKLVADEYGFDLREIPKGKKPKDIKDPGGKTE